jgi:hypothetical protein
VLVRAQAYPEGPSLTVRGLAVEGARVPADLLGWPRVFGSCRGDTELCNMRVAAVLCWSRFRGGPRAGFSPWSHEDPVGPVLAGGIQMLRAGEPGADGDALGRGILRADPGDKDTIGDGPGSPASLTGARIVLTPPASPVTLCPSSQR